MTDGEDIRAAGGVLWRQSADGLQLAIVHRPKYDDWSLPKGKLKPGEHPLLGACREVQEETGVTPAVQRRLPSQEYWLGADRKVVDYWSMSTRAGTFVPNREVDELRWVRPAEAATWLSYDRDRDLLRASVQVPLADAVLLLVRHARAGDRAEWAGDDRLRPLDAAGRDQAAVLCRALGCFGVRRVLAADRVRCVETVAPLADAVGVPVETEPALNEDAFEERPDRARRRIREIAQFRVPVAICSQGAVIPDLVERLAAEDGLRLDHAPARKASFWALSFVDGRLIAADYYGALA